MVQGKPDIPREIAALSIKQCKRAEIFARDEVPRPETTIETLAKRRPAFRAEGRITVGNAPGLNSGAAALARPQFWPPRLRSFRGPSFAQTGVLYSKRFFDTYRDQCVEILRNAPAFIGCRGVRG